MRWLPFRWGSSSVLLVAAGFLGYLAGPRVLVVVVPVAAAGVVLRSLTPPIARALAPASALVALSVGALASPLGLLPELAAGGAGLAFLLWLVDDPARPTGGVERGRVTVLLPALALGIAWTSALLLPSSSASLGVAAGLLAAAVLALAYLAASPSLLEGEASGTTS